jgi:hypothetical protein
MELKKLEIVQLEVYLEQRELDLQQVVLQEPLEAEESFQFRQQRLEQLLVV